MSSINGSSTLAAIEAAYDDNASYAEDNSVEKARSFITAARILLRRLPAEAGTREGNLRLSPELLQNELTNAQRWVETHDSGSNSSSGGPRVTYANFRNSRG